VDVCAQHALPHNKQKVEIARKIILDVVILRPLHIELTTMLALRSNFLVAMMLTPSLNTEELKGPPSRFQRKIFGIKGAWLDIILRIVCGEKIFEPSPFRALAGRYLESGGK